MKAIKARWVLLFAAAFVALVFGLVALSCTSGGDDDDDSHTDDDHSGDDAGCMDDFVDETVDCLHDYADCVEQQGVSDACVNRLDACAEAATDRMCDCADKHNGCLEEHCDCIDECGGNEQCEEQCVEELDRCAGWLDGDKLGRCFEDLYDCIFGDVSADEIRNCTNDWESCMHGCY